VTAPASLFDLPTVQDAVQYALGKLADWQLVPDRVSRAQAALQQVGQNAAQAGDAVTVAQLTVIKQSLDGVLAEYTQAAPQVASVMRAAQNMQSGGTVSPGTVVDAAKLVSTMAANLTVLAQDEDAIRQFGGNIDVGPSGGISVPPWVKWALIGIGAFWLLRRL
jgi:hypothetical protein